MKIQTKALVAKILTIATLAIPLTMPTLEAQAKILFQSDFEKGSWKADGWKRMESNGNDCRVVSSRARTGRHSMMFNHRTSKKERCEINHRDLDKNSEAWYGFSTYVPNSWQNDPRGAIVTQWHTHPDKGEEWRSPPMAMRYIDGDIWLTQIADPKKKTRQGKWPIERKHRLGRIAKGKWSDWVVYYRWRYEGNDGLVEVWRRVEGEKNYQKVLTQKGPNIYNDPKGPYLKMGIYRSKYKQSKAKEQTIFHDAVTIGDRNSSFQEVAPGGDRPTSGGGSNDNNLALGRPVEVSSEPQKENRGRNAVDGKVNTRWSARGYPQTLEVKLQKNQEIGRVEVLPFEGRAYQFKVVVNGKVVANLGNNKKGGKITAKFKPVKTDAVELQFTGCHGSNCSKKNWVSIDEVQVFED